ncbi:hypothetical protein D9M72_264470 [compost metagenome]
MVAHIGARKDAAVDGERARAQTVACGLQRATVERGAAGVGAGARQRQQAGAPHDQPVACRAIHDGRADAGADPGVRVQRGCCARGRTDSHGATTPRCLEVVAVGTELQGVEEQCPLNSDVAAGAPEHADRATPAHRAVAVRAALRRGVGPVGAQAAPGARAAAHRAVGGVIRAVPELDGLAHAPHCEVDLAGGAGVQAVGGDVEAGLRRAHLLLRKAARQAACVVDEPIPTCRGHACLQGATQREVATDVEQVVAGTAGHPGLAQLEHGRRAGVEPEAATDGERARTVTRRQRGACARVIGIAHRHVAADVPGARRAARTRERAAVVDLYITRHRAVDAQRATVDRGPPGVGVHARERGRAAALPDHAAQTGDGAGEGRVARIAEAQCVATQYDFGACDAEQGADGAVAIGACDVKARPGIGQSHIGGGCELATTGQAQRTAIDRGVAHVGARAAQRQQPGPFLHQAAAVAGLGRERRTHSNRVAGGVDVRTPAAQGNVVKAREEVGRIGRRTQDAAVQVQRGAARASNQAVRHKHASALGFVATQMHGAHAADQKAERDFCGGLDRATRIDDERARARDPDSDAGAADQLGPCALHLHHPVSVRAAPHEETGGCGDLAAGLDVQPARAHVPHIQVPGVQRGIGHANRAVARLVRSDHQQVAVDRQRSAVEYVEPALARRGDRQVIGTGPG